jgi:2-polyprenyl-6-methoxyphenol hydroxylase-like FAD-dependent oxidoreductase
MRVAINGARIAGGCLAYWLERGGHDVVLIERAPQFRTCGPAADIEHGVDTAEMQAGHVSRDVAPT